MRTDFSQAMLNNPEIREANEILRTCVHCGFCLATCPTYLLLGDELDSPRGRIYLAKEMLEGGRPPTAPVVKHLDRCLTCLSCMTTLSVRGPLRPPRRARPRTHRENLRAALAGSDAETNAGDGGAEPVAVPPGVARG
jgi:Fe-S oxidoreductase